MFLSLKEELGGCMGMEILIGVQLNHVNESIA